MKLTPKIKVWLNGKDSEAVFGDGKFRLLQAVEGSGSLTAAAKSLKISYRKAWDDLQKTEKRFGKKLIEKNRGGKGGGNTRLTPEGKKLLDAYSEFCSEMKKRVNDVYRKTLEEVIDEATKLLIPMSKTT